MTSCSSLNVLIADDDRIPRHLLRRMLERWGHEVVEAEDGHQAWRILNGDSPPQVAILDWMMPGIDGIDLCRQLAQRDKAPLIYTILLTSKRAENDLVHALDNGAHDFQTKPVSPGELQARLAVGRRLVEMHDRLQQSLEEMERLATTDMLTGIANRRHFYSCAHRAFTRTGAQEPAISLLLLDIDHFKQINDRYGHRAGDCALRRVAELCELHLRPSDIVARFGGDEIAALLPDAQLDEARAIAERLRAAIASEVLDIGPGSASQSPVHLSVSIGCATTRQASITIDELLGQADASLLRAKSEGRNRVTC